MRLINYIIGKGRDKEAYIHREKPRNKHGTLFRIGVISAVAVVALNVGIIGYAVYQNQASSNSNNSIKSANYAQDIKIDSGNASTVAMKNNLLTSDLALNGHTVSITPKSGAGYSPKGFCVITVSDKDAQGQPRADRKFRTGIINAGSTFTLNLQVLNEFGNSVKFEPFWGDPNNFNDYKNLAVITSAGTDIGEEPASQVKYNTFTHSDNFANVDSYLYRVGNGNTVKLGALFKVDTAGDSAVDPSKVKIKVTAEEPDSSVKGSGTNLESGSTAMCVYTKNASDWLNSTLKFTGEGPVKVTICEDKGDTYTLNLEIVNGNNATSATSVSSTNIILLNNVSTGGISVNGKTLYGNGFSVRDTRSQPNGTSGFVTLSGNCTVDNVKFIGYEPANAVTDGTSNPGYAPSVRIGGSANIYRSYISGGRYAAFIDADGADIYMIDTVIDGGAIGNVSLSAGDLTLENCTTTTSTRGGLKGLGVHVPSSTGIKLNIKGSFEQRNWLKQSDVPSAYSSILSSVYNDSTYAYTSDGTKYVNMGVFFLSSSSISVEQVNTILTDSSGNDYEKIEKTAMNVKGVCYTAKATMGSRERLQGAQFTPNQYYTVPSATFDFTTKNYIPKTDGSSDYCYYDSTTKMVNISFEQGHTFNWDTSILTLGKYGNSLSYSVSMNGTDYSGSRIPLTESGNYTVTYSYTDPYNYDYAHNKFGVTYTKSVKLHVVAYEPEAVVYKAAFSYVSTWQNSAIQKTINNNTYVMPNVSGTSTSIGSTTVGGQTVYYPIVTVNPTSSDGITAYSSGKGYYFAPVFNAINITDYNQSTGAAQYTYNKNSSNWPHGKSSGNGPDSAIFGYASGAVLANQPYARSTNSQYYRFKKNNNGLCYTTEEIEKDNAASTHLVQYHYVSNDGTTYYYYIQYSFSEMTYKSGGCFAKGTLITLADGTSKPVELVEPGDELLVWNLETGRYDSSPVVFNDSDPEAEYEVLHACFSDGTDVGIVSEHGFFDLDLGKYVYINAETKDDYIGHHFVSMSTIPDNKWNTVTLNEVRVETETVEVYSPVTFGSLCYYTDGILSMPGGISGLFNIFDVDTETMTYDSVKMQGDIEKYGLFTYEDFEGIIPESAYYAFNGAWLKVAIGKGNLTWEYIEYLAERYARFF